MRNTISLFASLIFLLAFASTSVVGQSANVTTWHNDIGRTGQNTSETTLTTALVGNDTQFGRVCRASLDGRAYAQPLVVPNVKFNGQSSARTVAYVATMNNSVYAFDGTTCALLGQTALFPSGSGESAINTSEVGGNNLFGTKIGILGTPVISLDPGSNPTTGTLYVLAESESGSPPNATYYHRLWALDVTSLQPVTAYGGYVTICTQGCPSGTSSSQFSFIHIQRPGLLCLGANSATCPISLTNSTIYVAFSMMDGASGNPNGWIFGYNAKNLSQTPLSYETTPEPSAQRGGIWQGGAGLAAGVDSSGGSTYIYFSTGDGDFDVDTGGTNVSNSLVKLTTSLTIPGSSYASSNFFTPSDQCWRESQDKDFGSGGVMLFPDNLLSSYPYLAIKSEKENWLWVVKRGAPGGYSQGNCSAPDQGYTCRDTNHVQQCLSGDWRNGNVQTLQINQGGDSHPRRLSGREIPPAHRKAGCSSRRRVIF